MGRTSSGPQANLAVVDWGRVGRRLLDDAASVLFLTLFLAVEESSQSLFG